MTPFVLLEELKKFIEAETKDLLLPVRMERDSTEPKERIPEVYVMRLKNKAENTKKIPYILLQFIKSEDSHPEGKTVCCESWVRIIAATYGENEDEGALAVLNILTRIRLALLRTGMVGKQFILSPPLETIVYPDSTAPYYLGEMMTVWRMPKMESEVTLW